MKPRVAIFLLLWLTLFSALAQNGRVGLTTMNCYAFFGGGETKMQLGQPQTAADFWRKAQNLVGLLPANPPTFVALEEVGGLREVGYLAKLAATRYHHSFQPVFFKTKDNYTKEAVGALVDLSQGWGITGTPGRDPLLDKVLSKHLVIKLTNNVTALEICVVHLHRPTGKYATLQQQDQNAALKKWADDRLAKNPRANLVILGDFNESKEPGEKNASVAVLQPPGGPLRDAFLQTGGHFKTHADGEAFDRILLSESLVKGAAGLKFEKVFVQEHTHGKGADRYWFTDHFPVTAILAPVAK